MLTEDEELYVKELYKQHERWLAAKALDMSVLTPEKYQGEIEKIYGKDVVTNMLP